MCRTERAVQPQRLAPPVKIPEDIIEVGQCWPEGEWSQICFFPTNQRGNPRPMFGGSIPKKGVAGVELSRLVILSG